MAEAAVTALSAHGAVDASAVTSGALCLTFDDRTTLILNVLLII